MGKKYLILILLLGLGLRLFKSDQSFWLDEASQAQMSSMTVSQIWFDRGADFHPPLFYILSHLWLYLGRSETFLRLLPISFGVANIYLIYLFAQKLKINPNLSALLLAIAPFHVYYSQEFRSYSLLCLLGTLSMYFLFQKRYKALAITNALLLYTHYSSVFLVLTQFILDFKSIRYSLITIALYAPWLPQFLHQLNSGVNIDTYLPGWREVLSIAPLKALPVTIFKTIAGRITFVSRPLYGIYIVFVFAVTFFGLFIAKKHRQFLYTWAIAPIFIMLITSFFIPQNQPFRIIYILPALLLLLVQACARFPKLFLTLLVYISVTGLVTYFTRARLQRENWRQAINFVAQQEGSTVVKFSGPFAPFTWYDPDYPVLPAVSNFPADPKDVAANLGPLSLENRVLLFDYLGELTDPNRLVDQTLENMGFFEKRIYNFEGVGFIRDYQK